MEISLGLGSLKYLVVFPGMFDISVPGPGIWELQTDGRVWGWG